MESPETTSMLKTHFTWQVGGLTSSEWCMDSLGLRLNGANSGRERRMHASSQQMSNTILPTPSQ